MNQALPPTGRVEIQGLEGTALDNAVLDRVAYLYLKVVYLPVRQNKTPKLKSSLMSCSCLEEVQVDSRHSHRGLTGIAPIVISQEIIIPKVSTRSLRCEVHSTDVPALQ